MTRVDNQVLALIENPSEDTGVTVIITPVPRIGIQILHQSHIAFALRALSSRSRFFSGHIDFISQHYLRQVSSHGSNRNA